MLHSKGGGGFGSPQPETARSTTSAAAVSSDAVLRRAQEIGIDDPSLYWVAKDSLKRPMPDYWVECVTDEGYPYYFNQESQVSQWEHPLIEEFKAAYSDAVSAKDIFNNLGSHIHAGSNSTPVKSHDPASHHDKRSDDIHNNTNLSSSGSGDKIEKSSLSRKKSREKLPVTSDIDNDKEYWYEKYQEEKKLVLGLQVQLEEKINRERANKEVGEGGGRKVLLEMIEELERSRRDERAGLDELERSFAEKEQNLYKLYTDKEQKWSHEKKDLETRIHLMVSANKNTANDTKKSLDEKDSQILRLSKAFEAEKAAKKKLEIRLDSVISEQSDMVKSKENELDNTNLQIQHWNRLYEGQKSDKKDLEQQVVRLQEALATLKSNNNARQDREAMKVYDSTKGYLIERTKSSCDILTERGHKTGVTFSDKDTFPKTCDNISRIFDCFESIITTEVRPGKASKVDDAQYANTAEGLRLRLEKEFKNCLIVDDRGQVVDIQHLKLRGLLSLMSEQICRYGGHILESERGSAYLNLIVEHICEFGKDSTLVPIKFVTMHRPQAEESKANSTSRKHSSYLHFSSDLSNIGKADFIALEEALEVEQKSVENLSKINSELIFDITELKNKLSTANIRIDDQKIREDSLLSKFTELSSNLKLLRPNAFQELPEVNMKAFVDMKSRLADLEWEVEVANKRSADAESSLESILKRDHEIQSESKNLEISIGSKMEKKRQKIIQLKRKIEELEKVSKDIYVELQKSKTMLSETDEENNILKARLEALAVHDKQADKLKVALQDETSRVKSLESNNQKFRADNQELMENLTKSRIMIQGLEDQLHDIRVELEHREGDILRLRKRFAYVEEEKKSFEVKYREAKYQVLSMNNRLLDLQGNIRVIVRVRPLSVEEMDSNNTSKHEVMKLVKVSDLNLVEINGSVFEVDRSFDLDTQQNDVYQEVEPLVRNAVNGYRACLLAYGQTGAGKTHSLVGPMNDVGILYRGFGFIFDTIQRDIDTFRYQVQMSIVEIYNEKTYDLLGPSTLTAEVLDISMQGGMACIEGLSVHNVHSLHDIKTHYNQAILKRKKSGGSTTDHSSRSHLVVMTTIKRENVITGDKTSGLLYMVDLAGSERGKLSVGSSQNLKEAQHVNKSLSSLSDVMSALSKGLRQVPYRNSKLTFLLQNVINDHTKVAMVVNVCPLPNRLGESIYDLTFASQCRSVSVGSMKLINNYVDPSPKSTSRHPTNQIQSTEDDD